MLLPPLLAVDASLAPLFASTAYWVHLPVLIVVVSLVYGATRFDDWPNIIRESIRWMLRLTGFLLVVVLVLYLVALLI